MVRAAVELVDRGETSGKVMLSALLAGGGSEQGGGKGALARFSLRLQAVQDEGGNYLAHVFFHLYRYSQPIAAKLLKILAAEGVAVSPDSGYFEDLSQMDPRLPVPAEFLDPRVAAAGYDNYLDGFTTWHYSFDYRPAARGHLSRILQLQYRDGRRLDVDYQVVCDDFDPASLLSLMRSRLGPAGISVPARVGRDSAPRLFAAKQEVLRRMNKYNDEFIKFVGVAIGGLAQALPFGTVGQVVPIKEMFPARAVVPKLAARSLQQAEAAGGRAAATTSTAGIESGASGTLQRSQAVAVTAAERGTPAASRAVQGRVAGAVAVESWLAERRVVEQIVDGVEERSAQRAINDPAFMAALDRGRKGVTDAGTRFHNLAKEEARALVRQGGAPANFQVAAERALGSGAGSSRIDLLITTPSRRVFEFDWKTSVLSGLSKRVRESEMPKHALAIQLFGVVLSGQESRSWGPAVVRALRRAGRLDRLTPGQLRALTPWI